MKETVRRSARPGGNGACVPLGRTPSHESRGGASPVPCVLTMTTADVTAVAAARAQDHADEGEISNVSNARPVGERKRVGS